MSKLASHVRGFTLIESIMVMVIIGVIGGMVAVFIKGPIDAYIDMSRRADLTDVADTAVRRMARDIRIAMPNSVRNATGSDKCIEFMPTKSGGRYRASQTSLSTGDVLDFTSLDASFDMLGNNAGLPSSEQIADSDIIVVYNDGSSSGSAYLGANAIQVAGAPGVGDTANTTKITFTGAGASLFARKVLPSASPANRFQVLAASEHVAAFACSGTTLSRYSRTISSAWTQPATCAAMIAGATANVLATNVSSCSLKYEPPGSGAGAGRFGIVSISLVMTQAGESVNLYNQVNVDNVP